MKPVQVVLAYQTLTPYPGENFPSRVPGRQKDGVAHKQGGTKSHPLTLCKELGWTEKALRAGVCAEKRCAVRLREQFFLSGRQPCGGGSALLLVLLQGGVEQRSLNEARDTATDSLRDEEALGKRMLSQKSLFWGR